MYSPSYLQLIGCLHGTNLDAGLTLKAQLYINKRPIFHKANCRPGTKVNTASAANTFFPVNLYHDMPPLNINFAVTQLMFVWVAKFLRNPSTKISFMVSIK